MEAEDEGERVVWGKEVRRRGGRRGSGFVEAGAGSRGRHGFREWFGIELGIG